MQVRSPGLAFAITVPTPTLFVPVRDAVVADNIRAVSTAKTKKPSRAAIHVARAPGSTSVRSRVIRDSGGATDATYYESRRRRPRMLSRNEEKNTCTPTMISIVAAMAVRSSDSWPAPSAIH